MYTCQMWMYVTSNYTHIKMKAIGLFESTQSPEPLTSSNHTGSLQAPTFLVLAENITEKFDKSSYLIQRYYI